MNDVLFMAVDLGTSFIKAGIYDDSGRCLAGNSEPVADYRPSPGIFLQNGMDIYRSVLRCMRKTAEKTGDRAEHISAIVFTGQMAGFMGVDGDWNDVTSWSCSLDTRYTKYAKRQMESYSDKFLNISGTNAPLLCSKYEWFREEYPEKAKNIRKYLLISGFVIGKLGNLSIEEAITDSSYIAWTGLADIENREWSDELCGLLGISREYLPNIVQSHTICGKLSEQNAGFLGLKSGIPLIAGAGDKVAGCIGCGVSSYGDMVFEAASYGGFSCKVENVRPDKEKHCFDIICGTDEQTFFAHKYIPGSGITLDWFVKEFMQEGITDKKTARMKLEEKVSKISPGSEGVFAMGLLGGSAMPFEENLRGLWMGYTWSHKSEHFYRSLLECYAYDLAVTVKQVEKLYPGYSMDSIKIIGGGADSRVWPQILADVTGKRFEILDRTDTALWGACLLAGKGIGYFKNIEEKAKQTVSVRGTTEVNETNQLKYKKLIEFYEELTSKTGKYFKQIQYITCGEQ